MKEFREEAVKMATDGGLSVLGRSEYLSLPKSALEYWIRVSKTGVLARLARVRVRFPSDSGKPLHPFKSLETLRERLLGFQRYYEQIAKPFKWRFTRNDLNILINKIKLAQSSSARLAT